MVKFLFVKRTVNFIVEMEYMETGGSDESSLACKILCCQCGTPIEPNPANMCVACLRTQVDISEGIPKQAVIYFCKGCERYLQPPEQWIKCSLESRELLGLCLAKLKGLNRVRLIDAGFVWTEPHSKRIKVKLTIQAEVLGGAVLQQVFVVDFVVNGQFCEDCHRVEAKDFWKANVQVRQKTDHKKTFYYLEQLILKHKAHESTLGIKPTHEGIDFFYANEGQAKKMLDFLTSVVPCRYQVSKTVISQDIHSNTYNCKFTYSVEIVPVCKDCVVCLPSKLAHQLGGIGQICVVQRVSSTIHLIDPFSGQIAEVNSNSYWRTPFNALSGTKQLAEYVVMDIEIIRDHEKRTFAGQGAVSFKHVLADVWVCRPNEVGTNEIHTRTHLGHLLKPGDIVMGYDLANCNVNDDNFDKMNRDNMADVVLVKKMYADKSVRNRRRKFKLRHLDADGMDVTSVNRDYTDFLEDLEEDPAFRQNINIYKDERKAAVAVEVGDADDEIPQITLQEMLDDLHIGDENPITGASVLATQ